MEKDPVTCSHTGLLYPWSECLTRLALYEIHTRALQSIRTLSSKYFFPYLDSSKSKAERQREQHRNCMCFHSPHGCVQPKPGARTACVQLKPRGATSGSPMWKSQTFIPFSATFSPDHRQGAGSGTRTCKSSPTRVPTLES